MQTITISQTTQSGAGEPSLVVLPLKLLNSLIGYLLDTGLAAPKA